jgi:ATP-dependent Lon protease
MDREQANRLEKAAIKLFETVRIGYNIQAGGEGWTRLSLSKEHKERQSKARVEYFLSEEGEEWKKELRKRFHEDNPGKYASKMKGKKHSEEAKERMRNSSNHASKEQVQCPHCGKIGGREAMARWHFNRCKQKKGEQ